VSKSGIFSMEKKKVFDTIKFIGYTCPLCHASDGHKVVKHSCNGAFEM